MEADNQLTFYVDKRINNDFMTHAVADVQAMSDILITTTHTQVRNKLGLSCAKLSTSWSWLSSSWAL